MTRSLVLAFMLMATPCWASEPNESEEARTALLAMLRAADDAGADTVSIYAQCLTEVMRHGSQHWSDSIETRAADALAKLGPTAADATPQLIELLRHRIGLRYGSHGSAVARAPEEALVAIGAAAVPDLIELVRANDDSRAMSIRAVRILGRIGAAARAALPALYAYCEGAQGEFPAAEASTAIEWIENPESAEQTPYSDIIECIYAHDCRDRVPPSETARGPLELDYQALEEMRFNLETHTDAATPARSLRFFRGHDPYRVQHLTITAWPSPETAVEGFCRLFPPDPRRVSMSVNQSTCHRTEILTHHPIGDACISSPYIGGQNGLTALVRDNITVRASMLATPLLERLLMSIDRSVAAAPKMHVGAGPGFLVPDAVRASMTRNAWDIHGYREQHRTCHEAESPRCNEWSCFELLEPHCGWTYGTGQDEVVVRGRARGWLGFPAERVTVRAANGESVTVTPDRGGYFETKVPLQDGNNVISVSGRSCKLSEQGPNDSYNLLTAKTEVFRDPNAGGP